MNNILNAILKDTYTMTALKHRVRLLKSYIINQLFTKEKDDLDPEDIIWLNSLDSTFYQQFNKDNVYRIFSEIEAQIEKTPLLNIYLPFIANNQIAAQIGQNLRTIFSKTILFDTKFDPALIAGCALSWNGIYRDYSLRAKIKEKQTEVLTSFKKFLR